MQPKPRKEKKILLSNYNLLAFSFRLLGGERNKNLRHVTEGENGNGNNGKNELFSFSGLSWAR